MRVQFATCPHDETVRRSGDDYARTHYRERVSQFEREIAASASHHTPEIVLLGDSLVECYWGPLQFANRGINSDHIEYAGMDVRSRIVPERLSRRPEHIFVLVGVNDVNDGPEHVDRHLENCERLVSDLRRTYPDAAVWCISLLPTRDRYRHLNSPIVAFNSGLETLAQRHACAFVDAHSAFCDANGELVPTYSADGLHLSQPGYSALTRVLKAAFWPRVWPTKPGLDEWIHAGRDLARSLIRRLPARIVRDSAPPPDADGETDSAGYVSPAQALGSRAAVDLLWSWLRTRDSAYEDLYRGLCLTVMFATTGHRTEDRVKTVSRVLGAVDQRYGLSPRDWTDLKRLLTDVHAALPAVPQALKEIRVLFLGDCLYEEVALFLASECIKDGLRVRAEQIVSKNPLEQRRRLRELDASAYDVVFYSPFTYSFNPDYGLLLEISHATASARAVDTIVGQSVATAANTIDLLAGTFEVPVVINNASTIQRGTTELRRRVKSIVTSRTRQRARWQLNTWLADYVEKKNRDTHRHLFVLDEASLCAADDDQRGLGAYYLTTSAFHPTVFSRRLAALVAEHIAAVALSSKKLVITDLDDTLWDGIIGEGQGVVHHLDRQRSLKKLKDRGVILAISSKNDPAKVSWEGASLDGECFVAAEMSWAPKVQGIQRMFKEINLKPKDAVFLDDRPDERELVKDHWPEMHCADPSDPRSWRVFLRWESLLDDGQEFDRTALYRQREKREGALVAASVGGDADAMFGRLGLKATLKIADRGSLKRVAELINRTNQWNLCASRTTFRQAEEWHEAADTKIYTVQVDDKFGSMGTVCVVVVHEKQAIHEIPVFVLSCRVFGFGVETLVLDYLKRAAQKRFGTVRLRGFFKATDHNAPCEGMYRDHGFSSEEEAWTYVGGRDERPVPGWFLLSGFAL
jgi:FkbH-like protein